MQISNVITKVIGWTVALCAIGNPLFGQEYWTRQLPPDHNLQFILPASEGNFLLWGETDTTNILLKIDPEGNTVWKKTYGADIHSNVRWIQSLPDGTIFLTGNNFSAGEGNGDLWMCKIDTNGDTLWIKTLNVEHFQDFMISQGTSDGDMLLVTDLNDVLQLLKIVPAGEIIALISRCFATGRIFHSRDYSPLDKYSHYSYI